MFANWRMFMFSHDRHQFFPNFDETFEQSDNPLSDIQYGDLDVRHFVFRATVQIASMYRHEYREYDMISMSAYVDPV